MGEALDCGRRYQIALVYASRNELARAFAWIDRVAQHHLGPLFPDDHRSLFRYATILRPPGSPQIKVPQELDAI
jgi:hypothetical protein